MPVSPPPNFTREFARLVWLLVHRATSIDEQKAALRGALGAAQSHGHTIAHTDLSGRVLDGTSLPLPPPWLSWLSELATRMSSHSVRAFEVMPKPKAAEILGLARALAAEGVRGDHGAAFDTRIRSLNPESVTIHLGRDGFVRHATPPVAMRAHGSPLARTPVNGAVAIVAERAVPKPAPAPTPPQDEQSSMVTRAFSRTSLHRRLDDLLMRLRGDLGLDASAILDEVARYGEERAREGNWMEVVDVIAKLLEREATVTNPDVKRAFGIQYRRLSTPVVLRGLAELLPYEREVRDTLLAFFRRVGDPAADLLVDLLTAAESSTERRAYRDAIVQCPAAGLPLIHQLRHPEWYVVRNAAELLGEMNLVDADVALIATLEHPDARVRQAATLALIRLGTPKAVHTIVRALDDPESSVRLKAVRGLASIDSPRAVPALLAALDTEKETDLQQAILGALGKQGTPEAVERLAREARPSGLLRRKRPQGVRLAAVAALGEVATEEARSALRGLEKDSDREVSALAARLLRGAETELAAQR
jgi:HEAT repeat protein